jgi:hypothetical protein
MDDKFWRNRKVRALRATRAGREALGAWAFWWSWCLDDPTLDGCVPKSELPKYDRRSAELLCEVGFWEDLGESYCMHDFHNYNPTREQVESKREADRVRKAQERAALELQERALVARESRATSRRVASTRDPDPNPSQIPIQYPPPPDPPRAGASVSATPAQERPEEVSPIHLVEPPHVREAAQAPAQGPQPPGGPDVRRVASTGQHEAAARAAWGANGPSLLELDDLTIVDGEPPPDNDQSGPIRVIRPLDEDDPRDFAQRVRNRFQKLYEQRFRDLPNMGGPSGVAFPTRLQRTAEMRGIDPFELLANTFEVFARSPQDDLTQSHPYATFAARFGRYLNKPAARAQSPKDRLKSQMADALAKGDRTLYSELDAQYRAQFLGGRDARPACS